MSEDAETAEARIKLAYEEISFHIQQALLWKDKYELCAATVSRLEFELRNQANGRDSDCVYNDEVKRSLLPSQRDENPSSQTLL
jgi:hypothetical protein